jgi:hypothetical protein
MMFEKDARRAGQNIASPLCADGGCAWVFHDAAEKREAENRPWERNRASFLVARMQCVA